MRKYSVLLMALLGVAGCTPAPAVNTSREVVWQQFGNRPVDELLLSWGAPTKESHLTDGSRLLTYRHATLYDERTSYEQATSCEVSFMAKSPAFRITDVAMQGSPNECQMLSKGRTGEVRVPAVGQPYPYRYPYPYYRFPY